MYLRLTDMPPLFSRGKYTARLQPTLPIPKGQKSYKRPCIVRPAEAIYRPSRFYARGLKGVPYGASCRLWRLHLYFLTISANVDDCTSSSSREHANIANPASVFETSCHYRSFDPKWSTFCLQSTTRVGMRFTAARYRLLFATQPETRTMPYLYGPHRSSLICLVPPCIC
jgi:hypothetical protein